MRFSYCCAGLKDALFNLYLIQDAAYLLFGLLIIFLSVRMVMVMVNAYLCQSRWMLSIQWITITITRCGSSPAPWQSPLPRSLPLVLPLLLPTSPVSIITMTMIVMMTIMMTTTMATTMAMTMITMTANDHVSNLLFWSDTFVLNLRFFPFMNVLAAVIALGKFHFTNIWWFVDIIYMPLYLYDISSRLRFLCFCLKWISGFTGVGADDTFILSRVWAQKQRVSFLTKMIVMMIMITSLGKSVKANLDQIYAKSCCSWHLLIPEACKKRFEKHRCKNSTKKA